MRKALASMNLEILDMTQSSSQNALCDGGDVLYTGIEIFVGDSKRTTKEGADFLRESFGLPVHVIKIGEELHLKSNCSLLCPGKIIFSGQWNLVYKLITYTPQTTKPVVIWRGNSNL